MSDLAQQAEQLRSRAESARAAQAVAAARAQSAQAALGSAQAALVAEFPEVTSLPDARALLERLDQQAVAEMASVQQLLAQAGA